MSDPCLSCVLPECDDKSPLCGFVTITRARRPYMAAYYEDNRERKLSAAKARHERFKDDPEYREIRRLREKERRAQQSGPVAG